MFVSLIWLSWLMAHLYYFLLSKGNIVQQIRDVCQYSILVGETRDRHQTIIPIDSRGETSSRERESQESLIDIILIDYSLVKESLRLATSPSVPAVELEWW